MYMQKPVFFVFWACDERNPQQQKQHTVPRAAAAATAAAAAAEAATVVVRTATPTPDLDQLRRLPRQAMYLAGASPRTIKNDLSSLLCLVRRMLCLQLALFCVSFSEQVSLLCLRYIFLHMPNHSAVSMPHSTEGAEIYTRRGNPRCYKVCRAVCTRFCAGRCEHRLCCSLFSLS